MNTNNKLNNLTFKLVKRTSYFPDYQHLNFGILFKRPSGIDSFLSNCIYNCNNFYYCKDNCLKVCNWFNNHFSKAILCASVPNSKLIEFFQIWPLSQWVSSLIGLVALYALTTYIYNKRLLSYNKEMSLSFRFWMIFSDLAINLVLGIYYLDYRETIMGQLMLKCPIAVSPVIFLVELVLVILIKEYEIYTWRKKIKKKKKT